MREQVFARQKQLGVVAQNAVLTERPDIFPASMHSELTARHLLAPERLPCFEGLSAEEINGLRLVKTSLPKGASPGCAA